MNMWLPRRDGTVAHMEDADARLRIILSGRRRLAHVGQDGDRTQASRLEGEMAPKDPLTQTPGSGRRVAKPLDRAMERFSDEPTSARRAMVAIVIAIGTTVVLGGVAMWLVDRREYPDLGVAIWYALQTVTTVGYGDVPPKDPVGRLVGGVIMILAVAFLAMVTASITSTFFESRQKTRRDIAREEDAEHRARLEAQFEHLLTRLDAIEHRLGER
jgi:voltage-gated potassium channel